MHRSEFLRATGPGRAVPAFVLLLAVAWSLVAMAGPDPADDLALALGTVTETSTADFSAGTTAGTALSEIDSGPESGQLRLDAPLGDLFLEPLLSAQWIAASPSGYTPVIEDGIIDIQERDGSSFSTSSIRSTASFAAGAVFEARARMDAGSRFAYLGFTSSTTSSGEWAYFGTRGSGDTLVPVIKTSVREATGGTTDVPTSATVGQWHVYRIVWTPGQLDFYIDDVLVDTRPSADFTLPLYAGFYKSSGSDSALLVDWVRVTPYSGSPGSFESAVLDAGVAGATWLQLDWTGDEPAATTVGFETRTGETAIVDGAWSTWSTAPAGVISSPTGRYAQYRATLSTGDLLASPVLDEVRLTYNRLDIAPPNVVSVSPPNGASGILTGTAVMATFDEALDPATITGASFTVTPAGGSPVAAAASYDSTSFSVLLVPTAPLAYSTLHEARLTTAITDTDGNALAVDEVWTFTTRGPDLTPPTVVTTTPAVGAQQILANRSVSATFGEPVDPATITAASFTLTAVGGSAVSATVSYESGTGTATLDPDADLAWGTEYEARLTTAVADLAGNPLAGDFVWTFRTRDTAPICDVTTSSTAFAQGTLSGLMISETDSSEAGGQLRLQGILNDSFDSPILSPIWNVTRPASGTLPVITDGILDVQERDPAWDGGSAIESVEEWGPGVVLESRAMFIPGSDFIDVGFDVSTSNNVQYAWFSTAGTGGMPGEERITARVREYGRETVAIETGATFNEWHVFKIIWTQGTVEFFVDGILVATHTDVIITSPMHATFFKSSNSETPFLIDWIRVTPYTETQGSFESPVVDGGAPSTEWTDLSWLGATPDPTAVSFATRTGETATPDGTWSGWTSLADGLVTSPPGRYAQYRAELLTADLLESPVIDEVQLCHSGTPDTTPPLVTATEPVDQATGVLPSATVSAMFNESMDPASFTAASFTLTVQGGAAVSATLGYDPAARTATLTPDAPLAYETTYVADLTTAVTDFAGNALTAGVTWSFMTAVEPETTPPAVVSVTPLDGAVDILPTVQVTAVFSEPLDAATIDAASFTLTPEGGAAVAAIVAYDAVNWIATLTPQADLLSATLYEARVTTAVADLAGNPLAADHVWSFTVVTLDETAPTVTAVAPVAASVDVAPDTPITASFSEPLDPVTLTAASFTLTPQGGSAVPAAATYDTLTGIATLMPQSVLAEGTLHEARLTTAITDTAGNALASDYVWSFTTGMLPDVALLLPVADSTAPIACGDVVTIGFRYVPSGLESGVRGYNVRVTATEEVAFTEADFTIATLPPGSATIQEIVVNGANDYSVNYTILGADTEGIATDSELFTVDFHGVGEGTATIAVTEADLRDLANQTVPIDFSTTVAVAVDCGLPEAVTDLTVTSGHQLVTLTWQDPAGPAAASVAVVRCQWEDGVGGSAYPRYGRIAGGIAPDRPASYEDALADPRWTVVATVAPGVMAWADAVVPRGIYGYEVFALNGLDQGGPPAAEPVVVTNYVLGDVAGSGDGTVAILDVTAFGDHYATQEGDAAFDPVMDFGPTDDASGSGLPLPDGEVGFEDLVIVGLNFDTGAAAAAAPAVDPVAHFTWTDLGEGRLALRLVGGAGIKAVRVRTANGSGSGIAVSAGALLADQPAPTFLRNAGPGLDAGLAVLGRGIGLVGSGELLLVAGADAPIDAEDLVLDVRGVDGSTIEATVESVVTAVAVPGAYALAGNFPNPFNPATTIRFTLPEAAAVRLVIYGIDGRLVATLVDEVRQPGVHDVVWNGQDDQGRGVATGAYFCRMDAGGFREVRKMTLMK